MQNRLIYSIPQITLHLLIIQLDFKLNLRKHRNPHVCTHTKLLFLVALRHRNLLKQFTRQKMPELGSMFKLHSMMSGVSSCFSDITGDECSKRELIQGTGQCNTSARRAYIILFRWEGSDAHSGGVGLDNSIDLPHVLRWHAQARTHPTHSTVGRGYERVSS